MPGRVGIVVGFVALAALPALGVSAFAAADTGTGETTGSLPMPPAGAHGPRFVGRRALRPRLTGEQKQCLSEHGVTLPQRPTGSNAGARPAPPTAEQRATLHQAAAECGVALPEHGPRGAGSAQGAAV